MHSFLLPLFLLLHSTHSSRPYHATGGAQWTCNEGYFRTTAGDACQICSEWRVCLPSQMRTPCTRTADVGCVACPSQEYTGPNCTQHHCLAGYSATDSPEECIPCPVGSYCPPNSERRTCGEGETTVTQGAYERLQCVAVGASIEMLLQFWVEAPACTAIGPCDGATAVLHSAVRYGKEGECVLLAQKPGTAVFAVLRCTWRIGPLQEAAFSDYLSSTTIADTMQEHLRQCMHDPYALVYNVTWHKEMTPATTQNVSTTTSTTFQHVPFSYARLKWGTQRQQVLATLVSLTVVGSSLLVSIGMLSAALYLCHRRFA